MNHALRERLSQLLALLQFAERAPTDVHRRPLRMERNIILPARLAVIGFLYHSFQVSPWIRYVSYSLDVGVETVISLFWIYVGTTVVGGVLLVLGTRIPVPLRRGSMVLLGLVDALFLAGLTLITGGYDSILYWVFVVLVVRNTLTEPNSPVQLVMNVFTAGCYLLAGLSDYVLARSVDEPTRVMLGLTMAGNPGEVLLVRTVLLLLVAVCGFGVQLLLDRQRRAEAEAREFSLRESQLRSTGRLAAEIAHQLKNPLAIINNTTFSLQRAVGSGQGQVSAFVRIIQEEVERADRILNQVTGYARLTEGKIEKVDVAATLEAAIREVFPPGLDFGVTVQSHCSPSLPRLMIQRDQLRELLVNLLTNARDAVSTAGLIQSTVRSPTPGKVEILVTDNGPGIAPELRQRVFEAYYTTKPRGTGLGLAIVKNTAELYGGTVEVESELGKGTTFKIVFPVTISAASQA